MKGYGEYKWVNPFKLLDTPKLPNQIYECIRKKTPMPTTATATAIATALATALATATASKKELEKITSLCECLSISQLDDYSTWITLGMILKDLRAPLSLCGHFSMKSKKFENNDCAYK